MNETGKRIHFVTPFFASLIKFFYLKKKITIEKKKNIPTMPAKLSTITYVHEPTECLTQKFTVKELIAVSKLSDDDPTKVIYQILDIAGCKSRRGMPCSQT